MSASYVQSIHVWAHVVTLTLSKAGAALTIGSTKRPGIRASQTGTAQQCLAACDLPWLCVVWTMHEFMDMVSVSSHFTCENTLNFDCTTGTSRS
jgi:hypothetical protein